MKTKIFFILISLGTFNYFLASTYDFDFQSSLINKDQRKISTQLKEIGTLRTLSGEVSLLSDLPEGELKIMVYPYGTCNLESDPQCITRNQPMTEVVVNTEGHFRIEDIEENRYSIFTVVELENEDIMVVDAIALGGIDLLDLTIDGEVDLQIALSYTNKNEVVYK